ncbi:DUF2726 domain-containing protein [Streptomyces pristinaespiralis]|uniref:DUF2726 domain-containing protein n=1 Tax=Streptomyces pristinaespiralis (strain ATCC 25486 / DSM 40338 / CBS 914.69 / JCM 4507 / KCC S-0507 / NBRC 13074 / NRRL 2958 / 5647) TaxID=457429 RepID=B5H705_STRE2|nr:DUF2726 domain-containing protein [Streptomyces pristinaespiralis]EDY62616.1 conserved hypothetical protein [Streptomyces pristinaespiralis ATCC 25486]QMU14203.1 DUF2726 domain-containing protein [Streptomyces pristinaespiralis]
MELHAFENQSEKRTRRILEIATQESSMYWVNAKTRLEEVLSPSKNDSPAERRFLRDAHFDYTLHKESSDKVVWAFEFDGPGHSSDPDAIRRDRLKNRICAKANLPLLRIEDDLLQATDGVSLLEWLIRRWMSYERILPRMAQDRDRTAAAMSDEDWDELKISQDVFILPPELDTEHLFSLRNPYPPLPKISVRLLKTFGIREPLSLELNPDWREFEDIETTWHLSTNGGPLPDLNNHGLYSRSYCEVALRRVGEEWPSPPVFAATGEYMARVSYPTFPNQRTPFERNSATDEFEAPCGPPYGGSLWAAGAEIAWYRGMREVEKWATKNLPKLT